MSELQSQWGNKAMMVRDLVAALQAVDQDTPVYSSADHEWVGACVFEPTVTLRGYTGSAVILE